jgi:two-component system, NtrC family, response regulator GlrR
MLHNSLGKAAAYNGAGRSEWRASDESQSPAALNLIGESPAFLQIRRLLPRIAQCDATVLIQGETGTGKEVVARAIHYLGPRRNKAFIPVNCGAIPDSLFENELFGHVRGAYTDAGDAHGGVIGQADGGTLFLDEIEALSTRGQVALLRFLQDHTYRPVGCNVVKSADVRIIAAANLSLAEKVRNGEYRDDLFFRLQVLYLDLPPLRTRGRDIALLAEAFLERFRQQYGILNMTLDPASLHSLCQLHWPGNIRELENMIHRAILLSDGPVLSLTTPNGPAPEQASVAEPTAGLTNHPFREAKTRAILSFEKAYLIELLSRTDGNVSQAARVSGKERSRLGRLIRKHRLSPPEFRDGD